MQITFSKDEIVALATEIKKQLAPDIIEVVKAQQQLPPLLTRKQFMDFAGIGETKCSELFNRRDFPVNREFGHPRVPTKLLFEWIDANTDWIKVNAPKINFPYRAI